MKRPENGQFRPGTDFAEFVFDETGDTDTALEAGAEFGGYGSVLRLVQASADADAGTITMAYRGDTPHNGFDNVSFWSADQVVFVEDAGDTHAQPAARLQLGLRRRPDRRLFEGRTSSRRGSSPSAAIRSRPWTR